MSTLSSVLHVSGIAYSVCEKTEQIVLQRELPVIDNAKSIAQSRRILEWLVIDRFSYQQIIHTEPTVQTHTTNVWCLTQLS